MARATEFTGNIDDFIARFKKEGDFIFADATARVANSLARKSPVDTGAYLTDWDFAKNTFPAKMTISPDKSRTHARRKMKEEIAGLKMGDWGAFQNDEPYSIRLEYGYSKQAPQGVVRATVRRWRTYVRGAGKAAVNRVLKDIREEEAS